MKTNILIVRPGAIGDALLTFPLLRAIKTRNVHAHITFVSNPAVLPLATDFALADAVFNYEAIEWSELFSQAGIRSLFLREMLQRTGCAICWLRDTDSIVRSNLHALGIPDIIIAPGRPTPEDQTHIVTYLANTLGMTLSTHERSQPFSTGPNVNTQGVAIHPGSGGASKCWPVEHFAEVILALWQRDIPVSLLAGPADTERLTTILQSTGTPSLPSLLEILSNKPLIEVATHLQQCKAYLGNDSGITHLSAMLGIPTLALFGPSNPVVWRPIGLYVSVLHEQNIGNLPAKTVLDTITAMIDNAT